MPAGEKIAPPSDGLSKVAAVTFTFWIIKILCTTLGETGGDAVTMSFLPTAFHMSQDAAYAVGTAILAVVFLAVVTAQVLVRRFYPFLYWLTIIATTTVGTTLADLADRSEGLGYAWGSALLLALLLGSLGLWYWVMGSVSVHTVAAPKAEVFYWVTIMFSQTLGTALGDWTSDTMGLGYLGGVGVFGGALVIVALLYFFTKLPRTALFWAAFVLTRPLGAVSGDLFDKPVAQGGMAISRYTASAVLAAAIFLCVLIFPHRAARFEPAEKPA
jgi:uncharacterized membrane-anchored protein